MFFAIGAQCVHADFFLTIFLVAAAGSGDSR